MRRELLVPKLGLTMTEGTLLEWLVGPGERFRAGQSLFIIESEKAAVEVPAEADGLLLEATAAVGTTLTLGAAVGYWDDGGDSASAPTAAPVPAAAHVQGTRLLATPLARRLARERGVDLHAVTGSGPQGRIRARDLPAGSNPVARADDREPGTTPGQLRPATPTEQTIARRLVAAKREIPHFYLSLEADVSALLKVRAELNEAQPQQRLTLNHFIVAAVGRALAEMPQVNRVWTAEGILSLPSTDVGMAVHTERGLTVPVLRDIGSKRLSEVAHVAADAVRKAQAGRLTAADFAGGAITVSNAGMHDVTYMARSSTPASP
jgi:pyruvate dehydrogenase E2 component (dihydrolipoamide acetyltransferase)